MNKIITLFALCIVNLLYMHDFIALTYVPELIDCVSWIDNLLGAVLDVSLIMLIFILLTKGKIKASLAITFTITLLWAYCNIFYCRFFQSYISFSTICQGGNLLDPIVIRSISQGFRWYDLFLFLWIASFTFFFKQGSTGEYSNMKTRISSVIILPISFFLFIDLAAHGLYCLANSNYRYLSYYGHRLYSRHLSKTTALCDPIITTFHRGSIRMLISEGYDELKGVIELSEKQIRTIKQTAQESQAYMVHTNNGKTPQTTPNIIFIIVESYMAFTSDMVVDDKEITPNLNALRHDSTTYYNGKMQPNITLGESADGQFIYMTGLLPLRSSITISKARNRTLPGLPKVLAKQGYSSNMIIPTQPTMWNQSEMCQKYGFNNLYSCNDYENDNTSELTDKQVFELAKKHLPISANKPFISVILTMSMHQPYIEYIDPSFILQEPSFSNELKCYLNACHYTDQCIGNFLSYLKTVDLYDKSVIIITADHHQHYVGFGAEINNNLPLYIIGGNIDNKTSWHGLCQQIDVYPTILDILGFHSTWCGLGYSLLSPKYNNSLENYKWEVSEWIIQGDYFSLLKE